MPFTIPNAPTAGYGDQSELDSVDLDIILGGTSGNGVLTGCAVTAQGTPDMTVAVAAGTVMINGKAVLVAAGNVTITTANGTNPRFDLITISALGVKTATAGTAAANAVFPAVPANSVILAAIYVPTSITSIASTQIVDKRVSIRRSFGSMYYVSDYGAVPDDFYTDATTKANFTVTNISTAEVITVSATHNYEVGDIVSFSGTTSTPALSASPLYTISAITGTTFTITGIDITAGGASGGTARNHTVRSATAAFTAADVGRTVVVLRGGASAYQNAQTTIYSVTDATNIALTDRPNRTQTNSRLYISRGGDSTTAIQAAIDAAGAAGGGTVFLPGVGYLTTGLTLKHRVTLCGAGFKSTMIHLAGSANGPVITNDQTVNASAQMCTIRDLWVNGNKNRQSAVTNTLNGAYSAGNTTITLTDASAFPNSGALLIGTNRLRYSSKAANVLSGVVGGAENTTDATGSNGATVTVLKGNGIYLNSNPYNTDGTYWESYDSNYRIQNVYISECKDDGIQIWGTSEARMDTVLAEYNDGVSFRPSFDSHLDCCTSGFAGRMGFYLAFAETKLTNCKSFYSGNVTGAEGHGFLAEGPTTSEEGTKLLIGCAAQDNKANGFFLANAQRCVIEGSASSNGTSSIGTFAGVALQGTVGGVGSSLNIIRVVCTERVASANNAQQNALIIDAQCAANQIYLTHGATVGSAVGTAIKSGSVLTAGNAITINSMGGYTTAAPAGAGTVTPDPYVATNYDIQMPAGNITVAAPANNHVGCELAITIIQDGTGSRTVTWNSVYKFNGAASPTLTTTASRRDTFRFRYNGTNWYEQSRTLNVG